MSTITGALAEFVARLAPADIPSTVCDACRLSILDTIGVAVAGADAPGTGAVFGWCCSNAGAAQSTLIGTNVRLPAEAAALFNATAASALDYDSYDEGPGYLHTDIVIIPAALAVAEAVDADGAQLLAAIVAGTEVATRLAHVIGERRGWYLTSALGVFGSAAAAAKLMGSSPEQIRHALGIAYGHSAGTHQSIIESSLTKRLHAGLAARAGISSAGLAHFGITAPAEVIEGQYGFYRMYQPGAPERVLDGLGARYSLPTKTFKKYPTCALTHAALDAAAEISRSRRLAADSIGRVVVNQTPYMARLVGGPFRPHANPQVSAQFSMRYCIASMLLRGRLGFAELETASVLDRTIADLADRIELITDQAGEMEPAIVSVDVRGEGMVNSAPAPMPGTPKHPLSLADLRSKFFDCFAQSHRLVAPGQSRDVAERIAHLDAQSSVRALMQQLRSD